MCWCAPVTRAEASHELGPEKIDRHTVAVEEIDPERRGILGNYDHRHQDILTEQMQPFGDRTACRGIERADEAVSFCKMRNELRLLSRSEHHFPADGRYLVECGIVRNEGRKFLKGRLDIATHPSGPAERWTPRRKWLDMLVPKMQIDEAAARSKPRSVRQRNIGRSARDLYSEDAMRAVAVFEYALPSAKCPIDDRNEHIQHRRATIIVHLGS